MKTEGFDEVTLEVSVVRPPYSLKWNGVPGLAKSSRSFSDLFFGMVDNDLFVRFIYFNMKVVNY